MLFEKRYNCQAVSISVAMTSMYPEIPHWLDQRYLFLVAWGFPILAVWGFSVRRLPVLLGLRQPLGGGLMSALGVSGCGLGAALLGHFRLATVHARYEQTCSYVGCYNLTL